MENLIKNIPRDIIALGSPVFFALVLVRVSILSNYGYLSQFVISGILFLILIFLFKGDSYSGLALIILIFTTLHYGDLKFGIFASLVYFGLIASLVYVKTRKEKIFKGVLFGAFSSIVSYYAVGFIF